MATFDFFTITPQQALGFTQADLLTLLPGSALDSSVVFNGPQDHPTTITLTIHGHAVEFAPAIAGAWFLFADGSTLTVGNAADDVISPVGLNNVVFAGGGDDFVIGHQGADVVQGNMGDDTVNAGGGSDTLFGGRGDDVLVGGTGDAGEAGDFVQGNLGDDRILGGAGADVLLGGQGRDSLQGGAGADYLSGDRGDDTLAGGAGADTFHGSAAGGADRILDFNGGEGDRIVLDHGDTFEVVQSGQDTVIRIDGGAATITLAGVDSTTLHGDWIVAA